MIPEIPWLERFDEKSQPDQTEMERVDYEVMLEELEFR